MVKRLTDKTDVFTASNYYISQFYYLAKNTGIDADELFLSEGLDSGIVDKPEIRVSAESLSRLVQKIWDLLDDEAMSLGASKLPRGAFYMMGSLTVHEPFLKNAIKLAARFYRMITSAYSVELVENEGSATIKCVLKSPEKDPQNLLAENTLMGWHRYFSWLIAENIVLDAVYFHYSPPPQLEEYSYLFPAKHVFNAEFLGLSFPARFLGQKNVQTVESLKVFMQNCPAELFLQPKLDFSLSGAVVSILKRSLKIGLPGVDAVAEELHLTKRTLIRRLAEEGVSFQKLKDTVRRERSMYLLSRGGLSVNEIAEQIGFSDSAVFARAFKSWTGYSPRDYKLAHLAKA